MEPNLVFTDSTGWQGAARFWLVVYALVVVLPALLAWLFLSSRRIVIFCVLLVVLISLPTAIVMDTVITHIRFIELCEKDAGIRISSVMPHNVTNVYVEEVRVPFRIFPNQKCLGLCQEALLKYGFDFVELKTDGEREGFGIAYRFHLIAAGEPKCQKEEIVQRQIIIAGRIRHEAYCIIGEKIPTVTSTIGVRILDEFRSVYIREYKVEIYNLRSNDVMLRYTSFSQRPSAEASPFLIWWSGDAMRAGAFLCGGYGAQFPLAILAENRN